MFLRSSLFSLFPDVVCAMSTRIGGVSPAPLGMNTGFSVGDLDVNVRENRRLFCAEVGIDVAKLATQHQVHGDAISMIDAPGHRDGNDAQITATRDVYLAVGVADCQPVMLYDRAHRVVAGVHAGWRGAAAHIVAKTLERMRATFGTRGDDVWVFVGPCASVCCYEVDERVASCFDPSCARPIGGGKFMLDLKAASRLELRAFGVPDSHIEISPACTIHDAEFFHSHRRDGARSGRMLAVIGMPAL